MTLADELNKLNDLRQSGALSEAEYLDAKRSVVAGESDSGDKLQQAMKSVSSDENMWGMFIHLSQFCSYVIPLAGLIVPSCSGRLRKTNRR